MFNEEKAAATGGGSINPTPTPQPKAINSDIDQNATGVNQLDENTTQQVVEESYR